MRYLLILLLLVNYSTTQAQTTYKNIQYANDTLAVHRMDIYVPANSPANAPCVMWIHGGGWKSGSKGGARAFTDSLLYNGYVIADINYRLSHDSIFPAQIYDCKAAVRFLKANATTYGIDTCKIGAAGSSAGGHLAALLGTSADVATLEDMSLGNAAYTSRIYAVLDLFGPTDFTILNDSIPSTSPDSCINPLKHDLPNSPETLLLGCSYPVCPARAKEANPITYISEDDGAFMIRHGTFDCTVSPYSSELLYNKLNAVGLYANFSYLLHAAHGDPAFKSPAIKHEYVQFFDSALKRRVCDTPTGFKHSIQENHNLYVWPNPTTDVVYISAETKNYTTCLTDVYGKIYYKGAGEQQITMSHYPAGIYFIQIRTRQQTHIYKIAKQ